MANITGTHSGSRFQGNMPGFDVAPIERMGMPNLDPYKIGNELAYRAYHQAGTLERMRRQEPQYAAPRPRQASMYEEMPREDYPTPRLAQATAFDRGPLQPQQQVPVFNKQQTGFNVIGGGSRFAMPWEQGATFSGYLPYGYSAPQPGNVNVQPGALNPQQGYGAHLTPEMPKSHPALDSPYNFWASGL